MGSGGSKPVQPNPELDKPWRTFDWGQKDALKIQLQKFHLSNPDVPHVRILVAGQIGAGKSSFINSVCSAFQGEIVCEAIVDNSQSASSHSFTQMLKVHRIRSGDGYLPFEIYDVMGLDPKAIFHCVPDDIVNTIYGHFSEKETLSKEDAFYNESPSLSDQAFCLVYILDANTVVLTDVLIQKLKIIRQKISDTGIPQVIVMTKVDEACPLVKDDLKKIYYSKKIKEKVDQCSLNVGVPMNSIFPVKNYHDEIETNDDVDVLILKAFDQIVRFANERLRKGAADI